MLHLHTYFTCKQSNFDIITQKLVTTLPEVLKELSTKLKQKKSLKGLTKEQQEALDLLRHVNTIRAQIPGSQAFKLHICNEIHNYFGYFGLLHIFLTFNPSPVHSPIFLVMCSNTSIDLTSQFPQLPSACERALILAKDPVTAVDFFQFSVDAMFSFLLGWDYTKQKSSKQGGILGKL
ncbi:hypothetical protein P691DRAFT_674303 [Macrolepiota fuliginosa MF-IS2]|uniref:Helitron helicase-like domain-containing protein n=1 Tax=Macrolepiota fuliginosa MF-IS2 TaxID=1400762 RepID=A0A9P5X7T0_9AGAR|nr:hypothetical protein P691DRAFT_674303 [Macrolepiota fuliginosa MF-IS2]